MEIPPQTVRKAIELCNRYGVKIVLNPSPLNGFEMEILENVNYLIPNEHEIAMLTGKPYHRLDLSDWTSFMERYCIENMVVTLGGAGCCYFHRKQIPLTVSAQQRQAVDTTGAGDTFLGAFVAAIAENKDMKEALMFANTAAGISVTRSGAQEAMPTRQEVACELQKYSS